MLYKIICIDDVCPENIKYFWPTKEIKKRYPDVHIIAFVVANYNNEQDISKSTVFKEWYEEYEGMVEIGVHGYCHTYPPEQEKDNAEILVYKSLDILKPYLKDRFLYRPPGFQRTIHTEKMLKKLGFGGVAYRDRIRYFDNGEIKEGILNLHCTLNKYENPIMEIYKTL